MTSKFLPFYWSLVEQLMRNEGCGQVDAQRRLLARTVRRAQAAGHGHNQIAHRLERQWGMLKRTYYRQLKQIRHTICIPH